MDSSRPRVSPGVIVVEALQASVSKKYLAKSEERNELDWPETSSKEI